MWKKRTIAKNSGQATVEYLVVGLVLITIIVALGALGRFVSQGGLAYPQEKTASHALDSPGGWADVLIY